MKKIISILIIILFVVFVLVTLWALYLNNKVKKGDLVFYQGEWYTKQQFDEKVGAQYYSVESQNTPEEVYANFRQALLDKNYELALSFIREEKREVYREAFNDKEKVDEWAKKLPDEIKKDDQNSFENNVDYFIEMNTENINRVTFIKNKDGYWEIDSI